MFEPNCRRQLSLYTFSFWPWMYLERSRLYYYTLFAVLLVRIYYLSGFTMMNSPVFTEIPISLIAWSREYVQNWAGQNFLYGGLAHVTASALRLARPSTLLYNRLESKKNSATSHLFVSKYWPNVHILEPANVSGCFERQIFQNHLKDSK